LFTDVVTAVCEKVANSIGFVYWPCIRVHGRVHAVNYTVAYTGRVVYTTARTRPCIYGPYTVYTGHVHGHVRAVYTCRPTQPVYTAVYVYSLPMYTSRAHGRVHDHVHGLYTAVYMVVYVHVYTARTRPCTRAVFTAVYTIVYTNGRVRGPYTCIRPCSQPWLCTRTISTAVSTPRLCTGRVQAVYRPCTRHGRVARPLRPLDGRVQAVYNTKQ